MYNSITHIHPAVFGSSMDTTEDVDCSPEEFFTFEHVYKCVSVYMSVCLMSVDQAPASSCIFKFDSPLLREKDGGFFKYDNRTVINVNLTKTFDKSVVLQVLY